MTIKYNVDGIRNMTGPEVPALLALGEFYIAVFTNNSDKLKHEMLSKFIMKLWHSK